MTHCFTGERFARTDVPLWLLPLWFVSVNTLVQSCWNSQQRSCCNKWSFISEVFFLSSHKQNEYLLSAYVTKEMNQHCKQVRHSKWTRTDISSLLGVNEIKYSRKLWGSRRNRTATCVFILSLQFMNKDVVSLRDSFSTVSWNTGFTVMHLIKICMRLSKKSVKMRIYIMMIWHEKNHINIALEAILNRS